MRNLFYINPESPSNEPTDEEIHFITAYIEKKFNEIENTDLITKTSVERQKMLTAMISIKNSIADLLSPDGGNYHKLLKALNHKINFETRLTNILERLSNKSGEEITNYSGFSDNLFNEVQHPSYGYRTFELQDYLNNLLLIPPLTDVEIEKHFKRNAEYTKPFQDLSDYLIHLVKKCTKRQSVMGKRQNSIPVVFFLRDTLLLYLGAKRLQNNGLSIDARAALINRKLIHSFISSEENNSIYKKSYDLIFKLLSTYQGIFSNEFIEQYHEMFKRSLTPNEIELLKYINDYLETLLGKKKRFIGVDTAAHGTMPLLAHVATGRLHSLELFTSTPWLFEFYSENIFTNNFPRMRTLESLVCQEELFEFAYILNDKIYIKETCDPLVISKSKFEIRLFLNIVHKNTPSF